jgi:hypothetical protein
MGDRQLAGKFESRYTRMVDCAGNYPCRYAKHYEKEEHACQEVVIGRRIPVRAYAVYEKGQYCESASKFNPP